jgi:hypothetical protein
MKHKGFVYMALLVVLLWKGCSHTNHIPGCTMAHTGRLHLAAA